MNIINKVSSSEKWKRSRLKQENSLPSEDRGKIYKAIQLLFWPCPGKNLLRPQHKKSEKEKKK